MIVGLETRDKQQGSRDGRTYSYHFQGAGRGVGSAVPGPGIFRKVGKSREHWRMRGLLREVDRSSNFHTGRPCYCGHRIDCVEILRRCRMCLGGYRSGSGGSTLFQRFCAPHCRRLGPCSSRSCGSKTHSSRTGLGSPYLHPHNVPLCYQRGGHFPTPRGSLAVAGALSPPHPVGCHSHFQT